MKYEQIKAPDGVTPMELDIFVPPIKLAFEYNGEQHYHDDAYFGFSDNQKIRDKCKTDQCDRAGITLISIPYWWDNTPNSLRATIFSIRPDVLEKPENDCVPIPLNPPPKKKLPKKQGMIL